MLHVASDTDFLVRGGVGTGEHCQIRTLDAAATFDTANPDTELNPGALLTDERWWLGQRQADRVYLRWHRPDDCSQCRADVPKTGGPWFLVSAPVGTRDWQFEGEIPADAATVESMVFGPGEIAWGTDYKQIWRVDQGTWKKLAFDSCISDLDVDASGQLYVTSKDCSGTDVPKLTRFDTSGANVKSWNLPFTTLLGIPVQVTSIGPSGTAYTARLSNIWRLDGDAWTSITPGDAPPDSDLFVGGDLDGRLVAIGTWSWENSLNPPKPAPLTTGSGSSAVWVWLSSDGGRTWARNESGLGFGIVDQARFDAEHRPYLLIAENKVNVVYRGSALP